MSRAEHVLVNEIRRLTSDRIDAERERNPLSGYPALADVVIQYLEELEQKRGWRMTPPSQGEQRLRAVVGWPSVEGNRWMWPFTRGTPKPRDWWKPEYSELSSYNSLRAHAAGVMYRTDASPEERSETRRMYQEQLGALSPEYVERMAAIQADYAETYRREKALGGGA